MHLKPGHIPREVLGMPMWAQGDSAHCRLYCKRHHSSRMRWSSAAAILWLMRAGASGLFVIAHVVMLCCMVQTPAVRVKREPGQREAPVSAQQHRGRPHGRHGGHHGAQLPAARERWAGRVLGQPGQRQGHGELPLHPAHTNSCRMDTQTHQRLEGHLPLHAYCKE